MTEARMGYESTIIRKEIKAMREDLCLDSKVSMDVSVSYSVAQSRPLLRTWCLVVLTLPSLQWSGHVTSSRVAEQDEFWHEWCLSARGS